MGIFKQFFSKGDNTANDVQTKVQKALTENQIKTIDALRKIGGEYQSHHKKMLKDYKNFLDKGGPSQHEPSQPKKPIQPVFRVKFAMPVSFSKSAVEFISKLKNEKNALRLRFPEGIVTGKRIVYDSPQKKGLSVGIITRMATKAVNNLPKKGFEFHIDKFETKNALKMTIKHPITQTPLRSPEQKNLGDLRTKLRIAEALRKEADQNVR